jgi:hypothetical protein
MYQLEGTSHVNKIHVVMCMSTSDITTQDCSHGLFTWHGVYVNKPCVKLCVLEEINHIDKIHDVILIYLIGLVS